MEVEVEVVVEVEEEVEEVKKEEKWWSRGNVNLIVFVFSSSLSSTLFFFFPSFSFPVCANVVGAL